MERLDQKRQTVISWARRGKIWPCHSSRKNAARGMQGDHDRAMEIQAQEDEEFEAQRLTMEFCQKVSPKLGWLSADPLTEEK